MAVVEIWSEVECGGGAPLRQVSDWVEVSWGESLDGDEGATLVLPSDSASLADASVRNVVRIEENGVVAEYRILRLDDSLTSPTVTVTAAPILHDLGRAPLVQTLSGLQTYSLAATPLTPTQWIDNYILPSLTTNGISWVARGTVSLTGTVTLSYDSQTPLGLLRAIVANTSYEVSLRRNGSTNYLIDLVVIDKTAGVSPVAFVGRNVRTLQRTVDGDPQLTVVVPTGVTPSGGSRASGIEQTVLTVHTNPSGATVKIKDAKTGQAALQRDDQLNGLYAAVMPPVVDAFGTEYPWYSGDANNNGVVAGTETIYRDNALSRYGPVRNPTDGKWYWAMHYTAGNAVILWRMDPTTMKVDGHWRTTFTGSGTVSIGASPSGTAGTILLAATAGTTIYCRSFDCNAGTFSTEASYATGDTGVTFHRTMPWMSSTSECFLSWTGSGNKGVLEITAASPPVLTNNGVSQAVSQNEPVWCTSANRVFFWDGAAFRRWNPATPAMETVAGVDVAAPAWFWNDPSNHRVLVGRGATNKIQWYNASADSVTDTINDDTGQNDWVSYAGTSYSGHLMPYDPNGPALYARIVDSATQMQWYRINLTTKARAFSTAKQGKTADSGFYYGRGAFYDEGRKLTWHLWDDAVWVAYRLDEAPDGSQVLLNDSVADDGSGVSTITPAETGFFKDTGWAQASGAAGGVGFELRRNTSGDLLSEMPNAGAVSTYGRIVGFVDGSRYGYRGERQLLYDPLHRVWNTTETWESCPWWRSTHRPYGDRGHYMSQRVVKRASHAATMTVKTGITTNGSTSAGSYSMALKGFAASEWIPAGSVFQNGTYFNNGTHSYTFVTTDVQADGSGNVTVQLTDEVISGPIPDNTSMNPTYPGLAAPTWGLNGVIFGDNGTLPYGRYDVNGTHTLKRWFYLPWIAGLTTLRVTAWYSWHSSLSNTWTGSNVTLRAGSQSVSGTGSGTDGATTGVKNLTITQSVTESMARLPFKVSIEASDGGWCLWGMSAYLGPETLSEPFEFSHANDLWQFGGNVLEGISEPPVAYRLEVLEDDAAAPFALGGTVTLRDPARAVAATPRIVSLTRRARRVGGTIYPLAPIVDLENRPQSLVEGLVRKGSV